MKALFILLTLCTSLAQAAYVPNNCILTVGTRCFNSTDVADFESDGSTGVILTSAATTAGRGSSFVTYTGAAYQVPSGKTLICKALRITHSNGTNATSGGGTLGYSDTSVSYDSASPGTNSVYYGYSGSIGMIAAPNLATGNDAGGISIFWKVGALKYPFYLNGTSSGNTSATIYCKLQ